MTRHIFAITSSLVLTACGQISTTKSTETSEISMDKFQAFKQKEKFIKDSAGFYPGIADEAMRPLLTQKINDAADDFKQTSMKSKVTDEDYQEQIRKGLARFDNINLDTEDRERVCYYFEELMDMVGLESSNGLFNNFMYGFDPSQSKQ